MALDNYANLKAAVIRLSGRDDLTESMDDFIQLAEHAFYHNGAEALRVREMDTDTTLTASTTDRTLATLPTDFIEIHRIRIEIESELYKLTYQPAQIMELRSGTGRPYYYTIHDEIEFDIVCDQAYSVYLDYYSEITGLSSAAPTNDILTHFPEVYLHGILWKMYGTIASEEQKANFHKQEFLEAIKGANAEGRKGRRGPGFQSYVAGTIP